MRSGFFTYDSPDTAATMHWHLNFAHHDLFAFWDGPLLAQDEMQVLEHPDLASVRLALFELRASTRVSDRNGPTPILISGVPRRGIIDTAPAPTRWPLRQPFVRASLAEVEEATKLDPPTISNILAIAAPSGGHGRYTAEEITAILRPAITGFGAAVAETSGSKPKEKLRSTPAGGAAAPSAAIRNSCP